MLFRLILTALLASLASANAAAAQQQNEPLPGLGIPLKEQPQAAGSEMPEEHKERAGGEDNEVRVLLSAPRSARISSQMQGRVNRIPLGLGEHFEKGDLLVAFDCDHEDAAMAAARANLKKARRKLESQKALKELDAVSELDVELAAADVEAASAELKKARAKVDDCSIEAPYEGRIVRVEANEFEIVNPGKPLLGIVETGTLRLEALLPSKWLVWLKEGYRFDVHVDELDKVVTAEITSIGSRVDPVSQTIAVEARIIESPPGTLPGMSGNAVFKRPADG